MAASRKYLLTCEWTWEHTEFDIASFSLEVDDRFDGKIKNEAEADAQAVEHARRLFELVPSHGSRRIVSLKEVTVTRDSATGAVTFTPIPGREIQVGEAAAVAAA